MDGLSVVATLPDTCTLKPLRAAEGVRSFTSSEKESNTTVLPDKFRTEMSPVLESTFSTLCSMASSSGAVTIHYKTGGHHRAISLSEKGHTRILAPLMRDNSAQFRNRAWCLSQNFTFLTHRAEESMPPAILQL